MHKADAVIVGDGISGLLLALGLSRKGKSVQLISRTEDPGENTPLILPLPAQKLLHFAYPGSLSELKALGASVLTHDEIIRMKFPDVVTSGSKVEYFLLLSRHLLMKYLREKLQPSGVHTLQTEMENFLLDGKNIIGVRTKAGDIHASAVFDCTGSAVPRKKWFEANGLSPDTQIVRGPPEKLFVRFFETDSVRPLVLRSEKNFRGGIYPVENNLFVMSVTTPASSAPDLDRIDDWAKSVAEKLGISGLLQKSQPTSDWKILHNVRNSASDFYSCGKSDEVRGFYPLGDGLIFSNPIFGRGISLFSFQVMPLLESPDTDLSFSHLRRGELDAREKWKEISPTGPVWSQNLLRKLYLPLIEKNPEAYENFLLFYQMKISAPELAVRLLRNSLSSSSLR